MSDSTLPAPPKATKAIKQEFENLLVDAMMTGIQIGVGEREGTPSLFLYLPPETPDKVVLMARTRFEAHRKEFVSLLIWHHKRIESSHPSVQAEAAYHAYLESPEWHDKRKECIDRYDGRCAFCYSDNSVQCHHRTYARLYQERDNDLIALCKTCHSKFHNKDS